MTSRCNARCEFCYASDDYLEEGHNVAKEAWQKIIDDAKDIGCYTVVLSGGEPSINPDLPAMVDYVTKKKMLAFTTSNGISIKPKLIDELVDAGLAALDFSLHGPAEHHDKVVGVKGAHDKLIESAVYAATKKSLVVRVSHVITKESLRNGWWKIIWEKMNLLGVRQISLLPICMNSDDDSDLLNQDELDALDEIAKLPYVSMDTKNYSTPKCPAAREDLFINEFGEVQPCPFIPISFGNVYEEPMKDIFLRMQDHQMFNPQSNVCMPARDKKFINKYIKPALQAKKQPTAIDSLT